MNLDIAFSPNFAPGNNFFMYVNENWINTNPIPNDFSRWGSFTVLQELNNKRVKDIVESSYPEGSEFNKFSILYNQGLDESSRNNINEIHYYINEIQSTKSIDDLLRLVVDYQMTWNIGSPYYFSVYSDFDDANMNILHLFTGGLGLPDRDYYFLESKQKERDEYKNFIKKFCEHFKLNLDLEGIYKLEEKLAEHTHTRVQKRKPELLKNTRTLEQILGDYPSFEFVKYFFEKRNVTPGKINLANPNFFFNLNKLYYELSLQLWKDYYTLKFLMSVKDYLSTDLEKICFDFYGKVLSGTQEMKPLWKRVLSNTEDQLGQLIGQRFVAEYFSPKAKNDALEMIQYLKNELRSSLQNLEWMEANTKTKALEKLDKMKVKIGYPDKWRVYTSDIRKDHSYLKNNLLCNKADNEYRLNKLYNEIDRTEWFMDPQMVNAYYSPSYNEIVFPAGILQPPFFSENYDKALNFGGIGAVIGHEMTHGFDDQGCKYDAFGNLNNWWTEIDNEKYKSKTLVLKNQFDNYVIESMNVNGELTLGENLADLGGVTIALQGLKNYLKENPSEDKLIDGLTPVQRLFVSYSRIWRSNARPEDMKQRILTDPHSPPLFRVNGIVKNIPEFYEVFKINTTDELYLEPNLRAKIW
jgi:putative endopeptidase